MAETLVSTGDSPRMPYFGYPDVDQRTYSASVHVHARSSSQRRGTPNERRSFSHIVDVPYREPDGELKYQIFDFILTNSLLRLP